MQLQVGKVFAFQSVAMNIGTLAWPVRYHHCHIVIDIIINAMKSILQRDLIIVIFQSVAVNVREGIR